MTTITIQTPRTVVAPRGAAWAAWLFRLASNGIDWLVHTRSVRAERRSLAGRIADANLVRSYARNVATTDPAFAADLYAAADRHEIAG